MRLKKENKVIILSRLRWFDAKELVKKFELNTITTDI